MAEQALVAAASQVAAAGAASLRDAVVACQPHPHGAATPGSLPAALPSSLPTEEVPTLQAASKAALPLLPPPLAGTPQAPCPPPALCFAA